MISFNDLSERYGLKTAKSFLAKDKNEAIKYAKDIGFPVALKIESPDILHKTDINVVVLNINSINELEYSYEITINSFEKNKPNADIKPNFDS